MALYLDNQTGPELIRLLRKEIERSPKNFIAPRLLNSVESDIERRKHIGLCEHDWNEMTGKHTECNKCHGLKDGFEIWTSNTLADTSTDVS